MGNGIDREYLKLSRDIDLITVDLLKKYDNSAYRSLDKDFHFTPKNIAKDMIDLLEQNGGIKPDNIYIDLCCKSGIFLMLIRDKLMEHPELIEKYPDKYDRMYYILDNLIYGICPNSHTANIVRCDLYGKYRIEGNIKSVYTDREYYGLKKERLNIEDVKNKLKEFGDMKFDAVVGNPPYNSGMDLDFVNLGFEISNKFVCMITPAKWQTADENHRVASKISYKRFREIYQKHIINVVFYPCCKDVFDIYQPDGITYFLMNKEIHTKCNIQNICKDIESFNGKEYRTLENRSSLLNIGNEIIEYLGDYKSFRFPQLTKLREYEVWTNTQPSGYDWYATNKPRYVLCPSRIVSKCNGEKCDVSAAVAVFESDTIHECESFMSWIDCKFTRFFLVPNISRLTGLMTDDCFRFVPAPPSGKFDHIYTDEELYKAFNLPQKYIDVIEAVIKERK